MPEQRRALAFQQAARRAKSSPWVRAAFSLSVVWLPNLPRQVLLQFLATQARRQFSSWPWRS